MSKELVDRTKRFAIRIVKLVQSLPEKDKVANVLGKPLEIENVKSKIESK